MGLAINCVHQGDCVERLRQVEPGSVDLVFADPPFNIGYQYDVYDDRRREEDYLAWSRAWMTGVFDALKPDGTFWLAIGDEYAAELKLIAQREVGFTCRSWVIWYYTFGVNCKRGFSRSHTHLFHFVKDPERFTFNADNPAVRIPSARQLVYADLRANPRGRLPDNTWILRPQDLPEGFSAEQDTWYFARVAGTFKEREGFHGCQMPEQLLGRIIRLCSHPNELVLDPFGGSGTTLAVAKKLNRRWLGIELSDEYVARIEQRLSNARAGDSLDGPADPLRSAPATRKGKRRGVNGGKRRRSHASRYQQEKDQLQQAVIGAYDRCSRNGSSDHLLADPEQNARFLEECGRLGAPGAPTIWNQMLLRLRKQGALPSPAKRRKFHRTDFRQMDPYSFASEIALHQLSVDYGITLDGILCDPEVAAEFDRLAESYAPGQTAFAYRWAALALRKRAKRIKRLAERWLEWTTRKLPDPQSLETACATDGNHVEQTGVYLLQRGDVVLYVGETYDLTRRLELVRQIPAWQQHQVDGVRLLPMDPQEAAGLKAVLVHRTHPVLNSRLLLPQIDVSVPG